MFCHYQCALSVLKLFTGEVYADEDIAFSAPLEYLGGLEISWRFRKKMSRAKTI
jgi:esterase/lipase superfamily enzyme